MNTVFGHLALQFKTHPENLATEALGFILNNSASASNAFSAFVRAGGIECDESMHFQTQRSGPDDSRPDMNCIGGSGQLQIVVENKFWAGLTDNQPVTYLKGLSCSTPSAVLFVVPQARLSLVWNEVVFRCNEAGLRTGLVSQHPTITSTTIEGGKILAITSWRSVLGALSIATAAQLDTRAQSDIAQLQGLCEAMDNEAFLPLRGDELTNLEIPRRILDYRNLIFDIVDEAKKQGFCNRKGARVEGSGMYIRVGKYQLWLGLDSTSWRQFGATPIWVYLYPPPYSPIPLAEVRERLLRFRTAAPPRCFDFKESVAVPLLLKAGVEKASLVKSAACQLGELAVELGIEPQSQEIEDIHTEALNET
jgi:hypothetical protein